MMQSFRARWDTVARGIYSTEEKEERRFFLARVLSQASVPAIRHREDIFATGFSKARTHVTISRHRVSVAT
jgi:hypothetical protein